MSGSVVSLSNAKTSEELKEILNSPDIGSLVLIGGKTMVIYGSESLSLTELAERTADAFESQVLKFRPDKQAVQPQDLNSKERINLVDLLGKCQ